MGIRELWSLHCGTALVRQLERSISHQALTRGARNTTQFSAGKNYHGGKTPRHAVNDHEHCRSLRLVCKLVLERDFRSCSRKPPGAWAVWAKISAATGCVKTAINCTAISEQSLAFIIALPAQLGADEKSDAGKWKGFQLSSGSQKKALVAWHYLATANHALRTWDIGTWQCGIRVVAMGETSCILASQSNAGITKKVLIVIWLAGFVANKPPGISVDEIQNTNGFLMTWINSKYIDKLPTLVRGLK